MAWSGVHSWTTGELVNASIMTTYINNNLLATAPAIVTTAGDMVYASGANALSVLSIGAVNAIMRSTGSAPQWTTNVQIDSSGRVGIGAAPVSTAQITTVDSGATRHGLTMQWSPVTGNELLGITAARDTPTVFSQIIFNFESGGGGMSFYSGASGSATAYARLYKSGGWWFGASPSDPGASKVQLGAHLLFTDNTYDIGASGATRPRNMYLAGAATIGSTLSVSGVATFNSPDTIWNTANNGTHACVMNLLNTGGSSYFGIDNSTGTNFGDAYAFVIWQAGNYPLTLATNGTRRWQVTGAGHLIAYSDNTYDIGASGATRPRDFYLAGKIHWGGTATSSTGGYFSVSLSAGASTDGRGILAQFALTKTATAGILAGWYGNSVYTINGSVTCDRVAEVYLIGPAPTITGTLTNNNTLYLGTPTGGGTARVIDSASGAFLTTGGTWTNNPSWDRYKIDKKPLPRQKVREWLDWMADNHTPAFYRHDGRPLDEGREDSPQPIHQSYEHDTLFFSLDHWPKDMVEAITVDPSGAIGTKDTDGFLLALIAEQHAVVKEMQADLTRLRAELAERGD